MHVVVVGLGYVGLPLALALAKHFDCTGIDIDESRIAELKAGHDRTGEAEGDALAKSTLKYVSAPGDCAPADAYIITVPTPIIEDSKLPDLRPVISASKMVAKMIDPARRPVIVLESTVYPGVTEDVMGPLIAEAGHQRGRDFVLGYSPERINPGDREHTVERIIKVIAGEDAETTERMATLYGAVTSAGVFKAASIKTAEAAKVIENAQRDINIAFINEVTQIFSLLDVSIWDVLDAAGTKWNFLRFKPGLVGGHCIGVDPYYLAKRAQELHHDPKVILAGRDINDGMAGWIADWLDAGLAAKPARILMLGLTFKENVPDLRNSKVADLIKALRAKGHDVVTHDPMADAAEAQHEYGIALDRDALSGTYDMIVGAVAHSQYAALDHAALTAMLTPAGRIADIPGMWPTLRGVPAYMTL